MTQPTHPWGARLGVGIAMLTLAFFGLILTDVQTAGGWDYWKWIVPFYGLMALWLSWYLRRKKSSLSLVTLWHEVLHWFSLIVFVFLISMFVHIGIFSRLLAGLCVVTLLAQAVFLAGIYIERIFLLIGILLALFAGFAAFLQEYLYALSVPILLAAVGAIAWAIHRSRKSAKQQDSLKPHHTEGEGKK
ncbi:MAG: hypothetical protein A3E80_02780 [Chlamydiae bacterium RIFCSPHIGHO2_12_FULL_49_9]|nr:MAG: hypothetical protein A3E80_02780 [Chlamydiae bacterium RIFCSPHIGHO2_12_FULL_49_9]